MAKVRVTYRLEEEIKNDLSYVSLILKRTKNDIVTQAIRKYLDELIKTEEIEEKVNTLRS